VATYCGTCLGTMCDFCIWHDYNGDEDGVYTGDGYCRLHKRDADPGDGCDSFHCRSAKEGNSFSVLQTSGEGKSRYGALK
jgi:hypothetical protein